MNNNSFTSLLVWQKSKSLLLGVYRSLNSCKYYSFSDQAQRAAVSIMNNIAEGYARKSDKSFRHFLQISKGSAAEVQSMLILAKDLNYIELETQIALID